MTAGTTASIPITIRNDGTAPWNGAGCQDPLYVTYHLIDGKTGKTIAENVRPTYLAQSVAPGATVTVDVPIDVPVVEGNYRLRWDMGPRRFDRAEALSHDAKIVFTSQVDALKHVIDTTHLPRPGIDTTAISFFDGPDVVTPGGIYTVAGYFDFEAQPGTLTLTGPFQHGPYTMEILSWMPGGVGFKVPADICGELPVQGAHLTAKTRSGQTGVRFVDFVPHEAEQTLTQDDVTPTCSDAAARNRCNDQGDGPLGRGANLALEKDYAATGQHQNGLFQNRTVGTDTFRASLKNGWKISHVNTFTEDGMLAICVGQGPPSNDAACASNSNDTVSVDWRRDWPLAYVGYKDQVLIKGPCGVDYK